MLQATTLKKNYLETYNFILKRFSCELSGRNSEMHLYYRMNEKKSVIQKKKQVIE